MEKMTQVKPLALCYIEKS